jgi:alanine racemase
MSPTTDHQPLTTALRPTWAEISLPNLIHNYRTVKKYLRDQAQLMAVVKANAYGHGAVECAHVLEAEADWFGVALIEEGIELRQAGIAKPIMCLGGFWQGQAESVITHNLTTVIHRLDQAEELNARAKSANQTINCHVKVDTGLGRLGIPFSEFSEFLLALKKFTNLNIDGLLTHFAEADEVDSTFTNSQIQAYEAALKMMRENGFNPTYHHLSNSAGIHSHPNAWGNLARAGATLYGFTRDVIASHPEPFEVQSVLSLHSKIVHLKTVSAGTALGYGRTFVTNRESRIATLPIGYADGLRRAHSNQGRVILHEKFAPIVGRISMDLTIVDVTEIPDVVLGDEVILLGEQNGLRISAEDLAEEIGTISYEIACGISNRIPRNYQRT